MIFISSQLELFSKMHRERGKWFLEGALRSNMTLPPIDKWALVLFNYESYYYFLVYSVKKTPLHRYPSIILLLYYSQDFMKYNQLVGGAFALPNLDVVGWLRICYLFQTYLPASVPNTAERICNAYLQGVELSNLWRT